MLTHLLTNLEITEIRVLNKIIMKTWHIYQMLVDLPLHRNAKMNIAKQDVRFTLQVHNFDAVHVFLESASRP